MSLGKLMLGVYVTCFFFVFYMTMAGVFVAQASGVDLSLGQELGILAVLLLTSKGAAAV